MGVNAAQSLRERKDLLIVRAALERLSLQTAVSSLSPLATFKQWFSAGAGRATPTWLLQQLTSAGGGNLSRWVLKLLVGRLMSGRRSGASAPWVMGALGLALPRVVKLGGVAAIGWRAWQWWQGRHSTAKRTTKRRAA